MYNLLGLPLDLAKSKLETQKIKYKTVRYNSRFKDGTETDSLRVVKQYLDVDGILTLVISDFKTISQS